MGRTPVQVVFIPVRQPAALAAAAPVPTEICRLDKVAVGRTASPAAGSLKSANQVDVLEDGYVWNRRLIRSAPKRGQNGIGTSSLPNGNGFAPSRSRRRGDLGGRWGRGGLRTSAFGDSGPHARGSSAYAFCGGKVCPDLQWGDLQFAGVAARINEAGQL